jgi:hypothetical protein
MKHNLYQKDNYSNLKIVEREKSGMQMKITEYKIKSANMYIIVNHYKIVIVTFIINITTS